MNTFDKRIRTIAYFKAGAREKDVLENLDRYEVRQDGLHTLYVYYHNDGKHTATYDVSTSRWVN